VAKHPIDTDLYIDLIQTGSTLPLISELYDTDAPAIYFSSIVAQELLAGARSAAGKKRVEILFRPFEKLGRVVTPTPNHWKAAGEFWPRFYETGPILKANCQPW
jgi:predicted nucleic acid-binding protein